MKRLIVLVVGCLILGLSGLPGVFGQKKEAKFDVPELKEIPGLIENLKSKDATARVTACKRLGERAKLRAKDILGAVTTLLDLAKSDGDADVRGAAASTLGFASPEPPTAAITVLTGLVKDDKNIKVKTAAAGALGYFGSEAKESISALQEAIASVADADKKDKEKQDLKKAAQTAINMINGKKGKK
jgi:HEAT repeat protein